MKISNTQNYGVDSLKMLIFGEPGVGKTSLAGTIHEPTLIISAEAGLLPLRGKNIDVIDISMDDEGKIIPKEKRIDRLGEAYKYLNSVEARLKYKWVFIDSLSELNANLLEQLQLEFPERRDSLVMYGELAKRMRSLVKAFRDLPNMNVVFTALSEIDKDENGFRFTNISLIGKFAAQVPAFFDLVMYYSVEKNEETGSINRFLITQKTDKLVAKDRAGCLLQKEEADLSKIAAKIREDNGKVEEDKRLAVQDKQQRENKKSS